MHLGDAIFELDALSGIDVTSLCHDSRKAKPGALFFALQGTTTDGTLFAPAAIAAGAVAVVAEKPAPEGTTIPWVVVHDAAATLARACRVFYDRGSANMRYAGVTGTNG